MVIVLKEGTPKEKRDKLIAWVRSQGLDVHMSVGESITILGLVGDVSKIDRELIECLDIVDSVKPITDPYKLCSKKFHPEDTIVDVAGVKIGGGNFVMMAGPCSVESEEQIVEIARSVKASGANILRGGAFKPRTSPYAFQGLRSDGLELLRIARRETGLPIVSEVMGVEELDLFDDIDMIQIGARNMQNFNLLREVSHMNKPVLLKRGLSNTLEELLLSAEYVMAGGNEQVVLCERGIRTFSDFTRNTLDLSAVPVLHRVSHLPVIVDPSHATGVADLVEPMALAATACGADGIMVEVHNDPSHALCDGAQSLKPEAFDVLAGKVKSIRAAL